MYDVYIGHIISEGQWIATKVYKNKITNIEFHFMCNDLSRLFAIRKSNEWRYYKNKRYFKKYTDEIESIKRIIKEEK